MATTWYRAKPEYGRAKLTKDSRGFLFSPRVRYNVPFGSSIVGTYCAAIGGWSTSGYSNYSSDHYRTSGNYYHSGSYSSSGGITPGGVMGNIYAVNAYTVTIDIFSGEGTATGAGDYEEGTTCTIKATPNSGYVVKSINGELISDRTTAAVSRQLSVISDITVGIEFEKYFNIKFNTNTTDAVSNVPENIMTCVASQSYFIPEKTPTRVGYKFEGWSTESTGAVNYLPGSSFLLESILSAGQDVVLYAVWSQATLTYDPNGGAPVPASAVHFGTVILADAITREGRAFIGWKIGDVIYSAGANYNLQFSVTAVAQWSSISFKNNNPEAGSLSLYDLTANKKVATEDDTGHLIYSGTINSKYRVDCELKGIFFNKRGVYVDGEYFDPYVFTFLDEDVVGEYFYDEKPLRSVILECSPEENTATVVSPAEPDKDGKYVDARSITVMGLPAAGYKLKAANIINSATNLPIGSFENIENNSFTIDELKWSIIAKLAFVKEDYSIGVSVDSASSSAITEVSVKIDDKMIATATYGDEVVFSATLTEGFEFDGWYEDGVRISEEVEYTHTVTRGVSLVAKAKAVISLSITYIDNRDDTSIGVEESCSVLIDDKVVAMPFYVTLGDSFSYALVLGELGDGTQDVWKFDAWEENGAATTHPVSGEITPIRSMNLVAKVTSRVIVRTVTITYVNDESGEAIDVDTSALITEPAATNVEVDGNVITLSFEGTQEVEFLFAEEIVVTESLVFTKVVAGDVEYSGLIFKALINGDLSMSAYYGARGERTTSVSYADGCDRTMGDIVIDEHTSAVEAVPISVIKNRGEFVKLKVLVKNGYRFTGWYLRPEAVGSAWLAEADIDFKVSTNRVLYAMFVKDSNAIYKWEGSGENKMMKWRSKTYAASKPFNPSVCRIDTTGYPVWALSVEMFSAPDAAPTAITALNNVASQNSRRLPVRRMERYMQVVIENNNEVDAILVGTSMGGLDI